VDELSLTLGQKRAFESLIRAHGSLMRRISQRLEAAGQLGFDDYAVLLSLEESEGHRLTMTALVEIAMLSPSGVTRLVDRLSQQGLVCRECNPMDRRSMHAVITEKGLEARAAAWPIVHDAIREEFAIKVSAEEADQLASLLLKFVSPSIGVRIYT
jgi:DNA-binding MarR family transcriptional regulator